MSTLSNPDFFEQTLPLRYMDAEILANELDRILGKDGWDSDSVSVVQGLYVIKVIRLLTEAEKLGIEASGRNHYNLTSREAKAVVGK